MKHYRVNKLSRPNGPVVKKKDILASNDAEAIAVVRDDVECPVCDVWHAGRQVGSIV